VVVEQPSESAEYCAASMIKKCGAMEAAPRADLAASAAGTRACRR
jgi:hypothetical protein